MSALDDPVTRHKFTVEEYYRLAEVGILAPDARVELLDGEVIEMPPIGHAHGFAVAFLDDRLGSALAGRGLIWPQNPVRLSRFSEPQPDVMVVRAPFERYRERHPGPEDVLLLVEVSDSTLRYDREVKLRHYALHGIPEVWIVNLEESCLEVYARPEGDRYAARHVEASPARRALAALPDVDVDLSGLF